MFCHVEKHLIDFICRQISSKISSKSIEISQYQSVLLNGAWENLFQVFVGLIVVVCGVYQCCTGSPRPEALRPETRTDDDVAEPETGTRRVVFGRESGNGLVVRGARIGARYVTEACCDVVQFVSTRGEYVCVHAAAT